MVFLETDERKQIRIVKDAKTNHPVHNNARTIFRMGNKSLERFNRLAIPNGADRNRSWKRAVLKKLKVSGRIHANLKERRGNSNIARRITIMGSTILMFGSDTQVRVIKNKKVIPTENFSKSVKSLTFCRINQVAIPRAGTHKNQIGHPKR